MLWYVICSEEKYSLSVINVNWTYKINKKKSNEKNWKILNKKKIEKKY